ncbi:hypothetical protein F5Y02DRAFT_373872 [Annulohypoxylon stygium]|nr:hypothetical protein F5Y02DRAFT_373872 [Annulohypoxylon stygium]
MKTSRVAETGLTVLYEPEDKAPEVDIVFIHGIQGHPKTTWLWRGTDPNISSHKHKRTQNPSSLLHLPRLFRRISKRIGSGSIPGDGKHSNAHTEASGSTYPLLEEGTYWPADLLPAECPHARILTWGYDSWVTKGYNSANKNNLFGHAKDFMYAYERNHPLDRGVIFVAHSLGGLIVKEVLRRCETSHESQFHNILSSTQAVIFLGTPHRGSPGFASIAEVVRNFGSTIFRFDSNEIMIRALGIDAPELELSRESFISQWSRLQFTVKTFQEALPISGVGIGHLNKKVVPDISSTLDDVREHAETIPANHMDMCRYSSRTDPSYQKVGRELERLARQKGPARPNTPAQSSICLKHPGCRCPEHVQKLVGRCKKALDFKAMLYRVNAIGTPLANTCQWIFDDQTYVSWKYRHNIETSHSMLWIKGVPGSGKSTIMKEIVRRTALEVTDDQLVVSFYFNSRGSELEHTPTGMFRSILLQLLNHADVFRDVIISHYEYFGSSDHTSWEPQVIELQQLTRQCLVSAEYKKRVTIFIDALDECEESQAREIAYFFQDLTQDAVSASHLLDVCISCRHYPHITLAHCLSMNIEQTNRDDISTFVNNGIPYGIVTDKTIVEVLRRIIVEKSKGIFLWVVLVVHMVKRDLDNGRSGPEIVSMLTNVPADLETIFTDLFEHIPTNDRQRARNLVIWVLLGMEGIYAQHILPIDTLGAEDSSWTCNWSINHSMDINSRLLHSLSIDESWPERLVRGLSRGLIEVSGGRVQFIHETAREFFMQRGYEIFGFENRELFLTFVLRTYT